MPIPVSPLFRHENDTTRKLSGLIATLRVEREHAAVAKLKRLCRDFPEVQGVDTLPLTDEQLVEKALISAIHAAQTEALL